MERSGLPRDRTFLGGGKSSSEDSVGEMSGEGETMGGDRNGGAAVSTVDRL